MNPDRRAPAGRSPRVRRLPALARAASSRWPSCSCRWCSLVGGSWLPDGMRALAAGRPANPHGAFKGDCALCHGAEGWKPAVISKQFDHAKYGFPLGKAHAATPCASCHVKLDFTAAAARCASCHADPHLGELGLDCARCHGERSFVDRARMRRAHDFTLFPLNGGHATLDCAECHPPTAQGRSQYVGVSPDCAACHRAEYDATTDPAARPVGLPARLRATATRRARGAARASTTRARASRSPARTCRCRATLSWRRRVQGQGPGLRVLPPRRVRRDGRPARTSRLGFPVSCEGCHNTTTWGGARSTTTARYFPIYSGAHNGRWASCSTCHTNPTNYATFTCLSCHPARRPRGDRREALAGRRATSYDSPACYSCHPRGTPLSAALALGRDAGRRWPSRRRRRARASRDWSPTASAARSTSTSARSTGWRRGTRSRSCAASAPWRASSRATSRRAARRATRWPAAARIEVGDGAWFTPRGGAQAPAAAADSSRPRRAARGGRGGGLGGGASRGAPAVAPRCGDGSAPRRGPSIRAARAPTCNRRPTPGSTRAASAGGAVDAVLDVRGRSTAPTSGSSVAGRDVRRARLPRGRDVARRALAPLS